MPISRRAVPASNPVRLRLPRLQGRLTDFASAAPMGGVTLAFGIDAESQRP